MARRRCSPFPSRPSTTVSCSRPAAAQVFVPGAAWGAAKSEAASAEEAASEASTFDTARTDGARSGGRSAQGSAFVDQVSENVDANRAPFILIWRMRF